MRIVKRAMISFLVLFVLAVPIMAGEMQNYGYQQLDENQKAVYENMVNAIAAHEDEISFGIAEQITEDVLLYIHELVLADHPEYFWYDGFIGYSSSGSGFITDTYFYYAIEEDMLEEAKADFDEQVRKILSSIPEEAETDYDKALYLHDLLVEMIDYEQVGYHQTAYGALVDRKAVCAGYTRAYQYLLRRIGIDSFYVAGEAIYQDADIVPIPHAWNLMWIDGKCLYTDVTWDDPIGSGKLWHSYFNLTYDEIAVDHVALEEIADILPKCEGHDGFNYFSAKSVPGSGVMKALTMETTAEEFLEYMRIEQGKGYSVATVSAYCEDMSILNDWLNANMSLINNAYRFSKVGCSMDGCEVKITLSSGKVPTACCDHKYAKTVKDGTCSEAGVIEYCCLICRDTFEERNTQAPGHEWGEWSKANDIQHTRSCTRDNCDAVETEDHSLRFVVEEGMLWEHCAACGYKNAGTEVVRKEQTVTVYLGDWSDDTIIMVASYNNKGQMQEVYDASPTRGNTEFTFKTGLDNCKVKVFLLDGNYEPWLMEIMK